MIVQIGPDNTKAMSLHALRPGHLVAEGMVLHRDEMSYETTAGRFTVEAGQRIMVLGYITPPLRERIEQALRDDTRRATHEAFET